MNSREAFEAWLNPGKHAGNISPWVDPGRYQKDTHQMAWIAWQAAIAHARDVAANKCESIADGMEKVYSLTNDPHTHGVMCGARNCSDAIKEALK